jgi:transglutaminase-like putative cysteine protease
MRVRFDGEIPGPAERYFRGLVLWWFDGSTWLGPDALASFNQAPVLEPLGPAVDYEVVLEPTDQRWLFVLDAPAEAPAGASLTGDFQARRERPVNAVTSYRGRSHLAYRMQPALSPLQRRLGRQLPEGNPRTRELAARWAAETGGDAREIARRALALFNAEFVYSLEPPMLARDAVDDFLFETKIGYCEHFASAFAFAMRAADVPARVVIGYYGGFVNRAGNYLVLRRADAHAWTEIWIDGEGWVRIDPTAAVAPERIADSARAQFERLARAEASGWIARLLQGSDLFGYWWNRTLIEFSALRQRRMLESFGAPPEPRVLVAMLVVAGAATLLLASWWLIQGRRARDPVLAEWNRFRARLARAGLETRPTEGPLELTARAAAAPSTSTSSNSGAPGCAHSTAPPRVRSAVMAAAMSTSSASSSAVRAAGVAPATVTSIAARCSIAQASGDRIAVSSTVSPSRRTTSPPGGRRCGTTSPRRTRGAGFLPAKAVPS